MIQFETCLMLSRALRFSSSTVKFSIRLTDFSPSPSAEMIDKLTLTFNRTRQAVITKELIEIISGAAAL